MRSLLIPRITIIGLLLSASARAEEPRVLAEKARAILATHCATCHGPGGLGKGGFSYVLDRARLISRGLIHPGKAADSPLLQRIAAGEMPPPGKRALPSAEQQTLLRQWIEAGAPAWGPAQPEAALVTTAALLTIVQDDLKSLEPRQRRFARYLTITHLNQLPLDDLQHQRQAITKLVNALSWHPRITKPLAVDAAETVYRLDLRDYKWSARSWDRLAATYPYRLGQQAAAATAIAALAGCEQPLLRGDWFVATAARPPFYHDFLDLPATAGSLERLLQVDVEADLRDDNAVRAGFNGSGVARNNRILERHDAMNGAYWKSYDFSENTNRQNILEHPLGPGGANGFRHAGGEIIFHLPNGLHGYMLVDAAGRRLNKAPGEIVSDPKRPDKLVETGVSCFSCHVKGLLPKDDQVRPHVRKNAAAFPASERAAILALYAPASRWQALIEEDNRRFTRALASCGVPTTEPEVIAAVTLHYESVVDLPAAAAEMRLAPDDFVARLRKSHDLSRTLGALLPRGGTIQRQVFEESFADAVTAFGLDKEVGQTAPIVAVRRPFQGTDGAVRALAFAPDGRFIVTGGADRTVRLWDAATGKELRSFVGHSDDIDAVAASRSAERIVSAGRDRVVRAWDGKSGKLLQRLVGHTDSVRAIALSADGKWALTGGADRTVCYWNLDTGKLAGSWAIDEGAVTAVALSANGRLAILGSSAGTVRCWNPHDGNKVGALAVRQSGAVYGVALSADGRWALTGGNDKMVRLWDVTTGREKSHFSGHENALIQVAFTPDGRHVLSGSSRYENADRVVRVWDVASGKEIEGKGITPSESVEAVAFAPDGSAALLSHPGTGLRLWKLAK